MHLPHLQPGRQEEKTQDLFFGLNHNLRLRPGELYDMKNLSSDLFPVLSPRGPRGYLGSHPGIQGMTVGEKLIYVEGPSLMINGMGYDLGLSEKPEDCPKQLVTMGAYLVIFPDKKYFNTLDPGDSGSLEAETVTAGPVNLTQCTLDGTALSVSYVSGTMPENPPDQSWWLDTGEKKLKQYAASTGIWVVLESPLVRLVYPGVGRSFSAYDGVRLQGLPKTELWDLNGSAMLYGRGEDFLIFPGLLEKPTTWENPVIVQRKTPELDYVVECGNRLWGCRYGPDSQGKVVNELYSCKLGDFKNWECYLGISTDSYRVSLGSDGVFTGAAVQGGHPLFFKEGCLHKVFGQFPSNFQVQTMACRGVEKGSSGSLALVGDLLYYKSPEGICVYDGSMPGILSQALGKTAYHSGVAGALGSKYYISLESQEGPALLVYDSERGLWHKEDGLRARFLCGGGQKLYCCDSDGGLWDMTGREGEPEKIVPFMAQTGIIGMRQTGNKTLVKLLLRLQLEPGSRVEARIQYDSSGLWETLGVVEGMSLRSFTLPVLPRPCDHFRLSLHGIGRMKVFSAAQVLKPGGEGRW